MAYGAGIQHKDKDMGSPRVPDMPTFHQTIASNGIELIRNRTETLQINTGLLCNQVCRHCHLDAGPNRKEVMQKATMDCIVAYARRASFQTVDITGGAPEMNPSISYLIEEIERLAPRLMLRSNLTALSDRYCHALIEL